MGVSKDQIVGVNVRLLRDARGLSQAEVAEAMEARGFEGFYPQTVLKMEKGHRALKFAEGIVLAEVLGVSATELYQLPERAEIDLAVERQIRALRDSFKDAVSRLQQFHDTRMTLEKQLMFQGPSYAVKQAALRTLKTYKFEEVLRKVEAQTQHKLEDLAHMHGFETYTELQTAREAQDGGDDVEHQTPA